MMKKNFVKIMLAATVSVSIFTGCSTCPATAKAEVKTTAKKLKVGYYVDEGSRSNGAFQWAQLLF